MNDEADGVEVALRVLASEARRRQGPDAHPSPETLTAYHAGELTPAVEEGIQEHLAVCTHCTRLLLDLSTFLAPLDAGREDVDEEADTSWQAIRARLPVPTSPSGKPRVTASTRAPGFTRWLPRTSPLAAAAAFVLAALISVPLWIIARQLSSPETPPETIELSAPENLRGTAGPPPVSPVTVHARAASTTFLLRLARPQPDLRFRIELLVTGSAGSAGAYGASARRSLPQPAAVRVVDARTLVLVLAGRQLPPGQYRLRVLDAEQPSAEPLGDYPLAVVEP